MSLLVKVLAGSSESAASPQPCLHKGPDFLVSAEHHFSHSHMNIQELTCISRDLEAAVAIICLVTVIMFALVLGLSSKETKTHPHFPLSEQPQNSNDLGKQALVSHLPEPKANRACPLAMPGFISGLRWERGFLLAKKQRK